MKPLYILPLLLLLACKKGPAMADAKNDTIPTTTVQPEPAESATVGLWDFNGDGLDDNNITVNRTEGKGNPVEDGTPDSYTLMFNKIVPDLPIGCCEPQFMGEGDLDGDGAAELTVVQAPMNGCTYNLSIWSLKAGKWQRVFGPEMIPTGCEEIAPTDLNAMVVAENGTVYFYKTDFNDEDFKKVKTKIQLK
jgi:hypothetical protein